MKGKLFWRVLFSCALALPFFPASNGHSACRNPNVAGDSPFVTYAAASGPVEIKWFGHSFFQITSSMGTKIVTDPFGSMGFPMPDVWADVVTVGREHGNHNNVGLVKGKPVVLRGLKEGGNEWDEVNRTYRDVLIYSVPVHQRGVPNYATSLKGAAFVIEVDGLCILHSGDISDPYNEDQLQLIGHVDIILQVIGGIYTIGPEGALKIVEQLKPKIVIPMHFWYQTGLLERFVDGTHRSRILDTNTLTISKDTLPPATEIIVLKVKRVGDL